MEGGVLVSRCVVNSRRRRLSWAVGSVVVVVVVAAFEVRARERSSARGHFE